MTRYTIPITPVINVIDHDNEIVVHAELPGVAREDIDVSVSEYAVTIRGYTKHDENRKLGVDYQYDLENGSFVRTVGFLNSVDTQKARVTFDAGVLEVVIPILGKINRRRVLYT